MFHYNMWALQMSIRGIVDSRWCIHSQGSALKLVFETKYWLRVGDAELLFNFEPKLNYGVRNVVLTRKKIYFHLKSSLGVVKYPSVYLSVTASADVTTWSYK